MNMLNLRKATIEDYKLIYTWANDPSVRAQSFNSKTIPYEEHKKWFNQKFADTNSYIYIASIKVGGFPARHGDGSFVLRKKQIDCEKTEKMNSPHDAIGMLRIDIKDNIGKISYSVDSKYRGMGYGTQILKQALYLMNTLNLDKIYGEVKSSNIPSIKAFINAGYKKIKCSNSSCDSIKNMINNDKTKEPSLCVPSLEKEDSLVFYLLRNQVIQTGNSIITPNGQTYIIAEMSANHGGSLDRAKEIIYKAKESGADCVKIQTYTADTITANFKNDYFRINGGLWDGYYLYDLYKEAYTPWQWHEELKELADSIGIDFLSTPFDKTAVDYLEDLNINMYKIASFELVDIPLIDYIASKGKPIIMSTGMATEEEIDRAVQTIKKYGDIPICLLKCSSAYPALSSEMNLCAIKTLSEKYNCLSGLSDHTMGSLSAISGVSLGAKVIEKHFCLSRDIKTPDSDFSMEPKEFKKMVLDIREVEKALGDGNIELGEKEKGSRCFRKSIFAINDIKKDDILSEKNMKVIRPGDGLPPYLWDSLINKKANCDVKAGEPLTKEIM